MFAEHHYRVWAIEHLLRKMFPRIVVDDLLGVFQNTPFTPHKVNP